MLAQSAILMGGSQLVSAGGLLLAAAGAGSRSTLSTGLAVAAIATGVRLVANLGSPGPFLAPMAALVVGFGLAAWGVQRVESDAPFAALVLRGGFGAMAGAYAGFAGLIVALGGSVGDALDLGVRCVAALALAAFVDAPSLRQQSSSRAPHVAAP